MSQNPLDMVIGSEETQRDSRAAAKYYEAAKKADKEGQREVEIVEFRRAVAADPQNPSSMFELAYRLDLSGEEDEAISLYERICERAPAPVNALMNLAIMYEDRSDFARAERCLRQILETMPNHTRARLYMKDVQASREMTVEEDGERDVMKRKALLDTPVTDFELSVRARTCLKKMNIRTLGDLLRISEAELMGVKNFGATSLSEVKERLAENGLALRTLDA